MIYFVYFICYIVICMALYLFWGIRDLFPKLYSLFYLGMIDIYIILFTKLITKTFHMIYFDRGCKKMGRIKRIKLIYVITGTQTGH